MQILNNTTCISIAIFVLGLMIGSVWGDWRAYRDTEKPNTEKTGAEE